MNTYSRDELHYKATEIFKVWAEDILDELKKSKNCVSSDVLSSVEEGRVWLMQWAAFAEKQASGVNFKPGFNDYANLVNHCEWRKRHVNALSEKRETTEKLNEEIALIYGWIFSNLGGPHA